jgi:cytidine deaminase
MPSDRLPSCCELEQAARLAVQNSYCPYSGFAVGAALLTGQGLIVTGCNIENASYGLTLCAERVALARAVADGHRHFTELLLFTPTMTPVPPCGACLQMLAEFAPQLRITALCDGGTKLVGSLPDFLPHAFVSSKGPWPQPSSQGR